MKAFISWEKEDDPRGDEDDREGGGTGWSS